MSEAYPGEVKGLECPEDGCEGTMELRDSRHGPFYGCSKWPDCDATHGAHPHGAPLGEPADSETKRWRIRAHERLDRLWKGAENLPCYDVPEEGEAREEALSAIRGAARHRAYRWLARRLDVPQDQAHIGQLGREECRFVVAVLDKVFLRYGDRQAQMRLREWAKREERDSDEEAA